MIGYHHFAAGLNPNLPTPRLPTLPDLCPAGTIWMDGRCQVLPSRNKLPLRTLPESTSFPLPSNGGGGGSDVLPNGGSTVLPNGGVLPDGSVWIPTPMLEPEEPFYKKWWFWAAVGGVVVVGGAVVVLKKKKA